MTHDQAVLAAGLAAYYLIGYALLSIRTTTLKTDPSPAAFMRHMQESGGAIADYPALFAVLVALLWVLTITAWPLWMALLLWKAVGGKVRKNDVDRTTEK